MNEKVQETTIVIESRLYVGVVQWPLIFGDVKVREVAGFGAMTRPWVIDRTVRSR